MIDGDGKHLTDAQWLRLLELVPDDKPIKLRMPPEAGRDALLVRRREVTEAETTYRIHPDGSYDWSRPGG